MTETASDLEAAAQQAGQSGDWNLAYGLWVKRCAIEPCPPLATYMMVVAAAYSNRVAEAEAMLGRVDAGQFTQATMLMLAADIDERKGDYAKALRERLAAVEVSEDPYWAHFGAARAMRLVEGHSAADVIHRMELALNCSGAERLGAEFLATLLLSTAQFDRAREVLNRFGIEGDVEEKWALHALPGMTTIQERESAWNIARHELGGPGRIVDLGCWLGSLTASIAAGLQGNERIARSERIAAYDQFVWVADYMENVWPGSQHGLKDGDDFLPWFRTFTGRWGDRIDVRKQDLRLIEWREGQIGFLVVDAMKDIELAHCIARTFFPHLAAGSFVLHQDYCHFYTWWIHLLQYRLSHKFEVFDTVPNSSTVVFRVVEPLDETDISDLLATDLSDARLAKEAFEYSLSITDPADHPEVLRAYARCESENGRHAHAREIESRIAV